MKNYDKEWVTLKTNWNWVDASALDPTLVTIAENNGLNNRRLAQLLKVSEKTASIRVSTLRGRGLVESKRVGQSVAISLVGGVELWQSGVKQEAVGMIIPAKLQ